MSRLNIEDSLFASEKFRLFERKIGCPDLAIGAWVRVARMAQMYWIKGELIPKSIWSLHEFRSELVAFDIVEEREKGFYLHGSDVHFAWLVGKCAGGKKSKGGGRPSNINTVETTEKQQKTTENNGKQPPTPTPTPTPTQNKNRRSSAERCNAKKIKLNYFAAYQKRYGIKPVFSVMENKLVYTILTRVGFDEAFSLAYNYVFYQEPFHVRNKHAFRFLVNSIDQVRIDLRNPSRMLDHLTAKKQIEKAQVEQTFNYEMDEMFSDINQEQQQLQEEMYDAKRI